MRIACPVFPLSASMDDVREMKKKQEPMRRSS